MNLLTIKAFSKSYTDKVLFDSADFSVNSGEKIGVIGINGTGKSTLLRLISGLDTCDKGQVIKGSNVVVKYLPQAPDFTDNLSIYEYVITANANEDNQWSIEGDAKSLLNELGFDNTDIAVNTLSGGQKKKVALAAALLSPCDILVLDEPTNHLDNDMTEYLENYLNAYKGALVMVTHDRYFLDRVCNRIVEIDKGKIYSYNENYEGYLILKAEREQIALATERKHQNILRKEIAWIRRGARARSTKQKAHIKRYEQLAAEELIQEEASVNMSSITSRLGSKTIELHQITKAWNQASPVIKDFSYNFLRTDRIGVTGPNGCGKSTLMKLITGIEQPDTGHIAIGDTVRIGYFAQENEALDETMGVLEYVKETAEFIQTADGYVSAASMCERFLFDSTLQYQKIGKLSGGEKRRLYLLKILVSSPNVLILDEPTNDLDISTLCILEDYLDTFQGILIIVSHDRYFLDRVARKLFVFDGNGHISEFEGSYTDYYLQHGTFANSLKAMPEEQKTKTASAKSTEKGSADTPVKKHTIKKQFSYKEQREYDTIETDIEAAETALAAIETSIEQSATDFTKLSQLMEEKAQLEKQLDYLMERYVYLTDLEKEFSKPV